MGVNFAATREAGYTVPNGFGRDYMKAAMIASGGLGGGISSTIAGGNFWDGFRQGIITSGLNHVAHITVTESEKLEYNDKSLTKWARKTFEGVEGADKIKVKTGQAPKGRIYQDGKIYGKDKYDNYTVHEWGVQDGNKLYISQYTFEQGIEWLYLVTGHELMHYSFDILFPNVTAAYQHVTILDWQVKQLEAWGVTDGWMYKQSKGPLDNLLNTYPKAMDNLTRKGKTWENTGMKLINNKP